MICVYNLFDCLNYVTKMVDADPEAKNKVCKFARLLKKENIDFTNIIKETLIQDPKNKHGWQYDELLPIYLIWLKNENKTISDDLIDVFITYVEKNSTHISTVPENDFVKLGEDILKYIQEFTEFEVNKLVDTYSILS